MSLPPPSLPCRSWGGGWVGARPGVFSLVKSDTDTQIQFGQRGAGLGREPGSLATFRAGFHQTSLDFTEETGRGSCFGNTRCRASLWYSVSHLSLGSGPWGLIPESGMHFLGRVSLWKKWGPGPPHSQGSQRTPMQFCGL